jgi:calcium-dependent protein kinase
VSPEVLAGNYGIDCDMWSAGCILYVLLCGYTPFHGEDDYELCRNVLKGEFEMDGDDWVDISKEAKSLIKSLICKPEKRLTA